MFFEKIPLSKYAQENLTYEPCLFASPAYLQHLQEEVHLFGVRMVGELQGVVPFVVRDKVAYSLPRATFGGWFGKILPTNIVGEFWAWIRQSLRDLGAQGMQVKLPPQAHGVDFPLPCLPVPDLNYHLPLSEDFAGKLHPSERRRLRKAKEAGFVAEHWQNPDLWQVHAFIEEARRRKGFPMTLPLANFRALFERFPADYQVFTVRDAAGELASLTVTVRLTSKILYNFYPADAEAYLAYSPTVYLLEFVSNWARERHFEMLDLGIATENGARNEGLIRFKKHLGAIETPKYTFFENWIF